MQHTDHLQSSEKKFNPQQEKLLTRIKLQISKNGYKISQKYRKLNTTISNDEIELFSFNTNRQVTVLGKHNNKNPQVKKSLTRLRSNKIVEGLSTFPNPNLIILSRIESSISYIYHLLKHSSFLDHLALRIAQSYYYRNGCSQRLIHTRHASLVYDFFTEKVTWEIHSYILMIIIKT